MWELDYKESWVPKNWCFWTVVLEKTLESPLDCKGIKPANSQGNQPWILIGRTSAEAEAPILWPPESKSWLIWKDPDAGKDWGWDYTGRQRMRCLDGITDSMDMLLLLLNHFSRVWLCETPLTAAHQAPPSLGFSRQEHWSPLPFSSPMHESEISCVQLFVFPWTAAYQAAPSMGFSRQEYWSGVPLPSPPWTWVWVNSGSSWWTGRPGMLWFIGLQIVGHDWATELNWLCLDSWS